MLNKVFPRSAPAKEDRRVEHLLGKDSWAPPPIQAHQIRVILYQESSDGKLPVYDSMYWASKISATDAGNKRVSGETVNTETISKTIRLSTTTQIMSSSSYGSPVDPNIPSGNGLLGTAMAAASSVLKRRSRSSSPPFGISGHDSLLSPDCVPGKNDDRNSCTIGEMMFGALPPYKGMGTKIHFINSPKPQILLTKLFSVSPPFEIEPTLENQGEPDTAADLTGRVSTPIELYPDGRSDSASSKGHIRFAMMPEENTFYTEKRTRKFLNTSLEFGKFLPTRMPEHDSRMSTDPKNGRRIINYSLGIILSLDEGEGLDVLESSSRSGRARTCSGQRTDEGSDIDDAERERRQKTLHEFVFSHYALLEGKLHQLQAVLSKTLIRLFRERYATNGLVYGPHSKSTGFPLQIFSYPIYRPNMPIEPLPYLIPFALQPDATIMEAVNEFKRGVIGLYETPRIQEPLWLNMLSYPERRNKYANELVTELIWLLEKYDTKKTEFFISRLITAVLAHHLAWVPTVTLPDEEAPGDCGITGRNGIAATLPYNPLWAQLSDLYGDLCHPSKMSRTIVVGRDENLVRRILFILTYFMRCNQVVEMPEDAEKLPSLDSLVEEEDLRSNRSPGGDSGMGDEVCYEESGDCENDAAVWGFSKRDPSQDVVDGYVVVKIPRSPSSQHFVDHELMPHTCETERADISFVKSYGRSLFASYCDQYMSDFVLLGVPNLDFVDAMKRDMKNSVAAQVLEEPLSRAACIVADTNVWRCNVFTYDDGIDSFQGSTTGKFTCDRMRSAAFVVDMLSGVRKLARVSTSEACIDFIEDRLCELYQRSKILVEYVHLTPPNEPLSPCYRPRSSSAASTDSCQVPLDAAAALDFDESDLALLGAVASTHDAYIEGWVRNGEN